MSKGSITAELLKRYLSSEVTLEELRLVETWYTQLSTEHIVDESSFNQTAHLEAIQQKIADLEHTEITGEEVQPYKVIAHPTYKRWWYVAVAVIAMVCMTIGYYYQDSTRYDTIAWMPNNALVTIMNDTRQMKHYQLPDQSIVWLYPSAEIKFDPVAFQKTRRDISIQGKAFFEVQKMVDRPFQVMTSKDFVIRVLGTSFQVDASVGAAKYEVEVLSGKVEVGQAESLTTLTNAITLYANEKASFEVASQTITSTKLIPQQQEKSTWKSVNMIFNEVSLDQVALRLENEFGIKIHFSDPRLANCKLKAEFDNQHFIDIMNAIATMLDVTYEIEEKTVQLIGVGCEK